MDLSLTPEEQAFRQEVRAFLADRLPARITHKVRRGQRLTREDMQQWHAILNERGWYARRWPREYGGCGWSVIQEYLFDIETSAARAPRIVPFGVSMLGPVLIKYGSEAQRRHWLPRILDGTDWWCQGYSEPGAGSDLASLTTRAVRAGDHYLVNGQKTWTTFAQYADHIFCLVRTSNAGRKQEGISFLLMDLDSPGVEVRPIVLLDGEPEVNEVFFTDVRVPAANLVGEENKGWTYAKFLLNHERANIAGVGDAIAEFQVMREIAETERRVGRSRCEDPLFAARMARLEIEIENLKTTNLRALLAGRQGADGSAEVSMLKIRGTEIRQEINSLSRRALGPYARPWFPSAADEGSHGPPAGPGHAPPVTGRYLNSRKLSIFGGSNEIQREIIAKSILGI